MELIRDEGRHDLGGKQTKMGVVEPLHDGKSQFCDEKGQLFGFCDVMLLKWSNFMSSLLKYILKESEAYKRPLKFSKFY